MLVQTIEKLDLFMLFIKTNSHQAKRLVFLYAQRSPVRLVSVEVAQLHPVLFKMRGRAKERGL